jgi:Zn-dependent peptidase ImmA (M78 family)/DNA-binding XRE family transcriptional regulator
MPSSTPGFVGQRLREARQVRGLRAVELAEKLGVSAQAVSSYETGTKRPSPEVADAIATKLEMPAQFFTLAPRAESGDPVFYRSMSAATKSARTRAEFREAWLEDITRYLGTYVDFPEVKLPDFGLPANPLLISDDEIEQLAEDARSAWRMSAAPIANMVTLLENQGVIVARDRLGAATLDSLSRYADRPYVMIGTDKGTSVRWRFDAAHELGHLLLHRRINPRDLTEPAHFKQIEDQAHRFAGAFLVPMSSFSEEFFSASLDALRAMKPRWRVSIAMMIRRARDGGLISEQHERRLWINYSRRGWKRNEPLDDILEAEEPRLLRSAVELIFSQGGQTGSDLAHAVSLADEDIESLCGLPPMFLRDADAPPVSLRASSKSNVYQFRSRAPAAHRLF